MVIIGVVAVVILVTMMTMMTMMVVTLAMKMANSVADKKKTNASYVQTGGPNKME